EKKTKKDVSKDDSAPGVIVRLNDGKALAATRKVGNGEVVFVGTAAHHEGLDVRTFNPTWTDLGTSPVFIPFLDVTTNYLVHGQTQSRRCPQMVSDRSCRSGLQPRPSRRQARPPRHPREIQGPLRRHRHRSA